MSAAYILRREGGAPASEVNLWRPSHRTPTTECACPVRRSQAAEAGTVVIVDIANNPARRGWCIYEWDHTILHHGPDGLHMPLASTADRALLIASIDVANAECYLEEDKQMILAKVPRGPSNLGSGVHPRRTWGTPSESRVHLFRV